MHLDDGLVQRLLDAELAAREETAAREHLAGCAECRTRLAEAERDFRAIQALLQHLDHPRPEVPAQAVVARAGVPGFPWRRAAVVALMLGGAGVAYALPGSPLPSLMRAARAWLAGGRARPDPVSVRPQAEPAGAGIAVVPGDDLLIVFPSPRAGARARVSLTADSEVMVRAPVGAATFTSEPARLVIETRAPATFEIGIPRDAPRVEIRLGERRLFLKRGPRVTADVAGPAGGPYLLPLAPADR